MVSTTDSKAQIISMLDSFNLAAANADYNNYFKHFTEDAVFIGTDATERWNKKSFMAWAQPFFNKGKAWNFTAIDRNIYFDKTGNMAWFDELLKTQMKICRGSGVVIKEADEWKIEQYVLSATIPNNLIDSITKLKTPVDDSIINAIIKK